LRDAWSYVSQNPAALLSLIVLAVMIVAAIFGPLLTGHDPNRVNLVAAYAPPSATNLLGTDENGRDVLTRLLYGLRVSLGIGGAAAAVAVFLGTMLGAVAGYFGGIRDSVIMRLTDGFLSIPIFFLLLTILSLFGSTTWNIMLLIGATSWMQIARIVRSEVIHAKALEFVEAAESIGATHTRVLGRHVLPQATGSIVVGATLAVAYAILIETALSYLGIGVQPPAASLGNLLSASQNYIYSAPQLSIYPGVAIVIVVLALNTLGNALRDVLDPVVRSSAS